MRLLGSSPLNTGANVTATVQLVPGASVLPAGEYAAVRVFLEADRALRLRRGIERDGDAYRPHWERWAAQERRLFARDGTRQRADLVIDTTTV